MMYAEELIVWSDYMDLSIDEQFFQENDCLPDFDLKRNGI